VQSDQTAFAQRSAELFCNCAHAMCWQRRRAFAEHLEVEPEAFGAGTQATVEKNAAVERSKENVDCLFAQAAASEIRQRCFVIACQHCIDWLTAQTLCEQQDAQFIERRDNRSERGIDGSRRIAQWIGQNKTSTMETNDRARIKTPQMQRFHIKMAARRRVRLEQNLKPPVERKTVGVVGAHAPADAITGFNNRDIHPKRVEYAATGQSCKSCANNQHMHSCARLTKLTIRETIDGYSTL
jgi:hypothetical protein